MVNEKELMSKTVLKALVDNAADVIAPVWPMKTIIACNPLQGLEGLPFEDAVTRGDLLFNGGGFFKKFQSASNQQQWGEVDRPDLLKADYTNEVNEILIKWLTAFLDEGQANIIIPQRHQGFYSSIKALLIYDQDVIKCDQSVQGWLRMLPASSDEALILCLKQKNINENYWEDYLRESLITLNGWSGFIKWRSKAVDYRPQIEAPISLSDYLAIRLIIECAVIKKWPNHPKWQPFEFNNSLDDKPFKQLEQKEKMYQQDVLGQLQKEVAKYQQDKTQVLRPKAQLVFCIDVRSEAFRRAIEQQGHYVTFGFAGFFALPIRIHDFSHQDSCDSCPVLLKPRHDIYEEPVKGVSQNRIQRYYQGKDFLYQLKEVYIKLKFNVATPLALAEGFGPWCGVLMMMRTVMPNAYESIKKWATQTVQPSVATEHIVQMVPGDKRLCGISFAEQALYAEAFLRMISLTENFAPYVALLGHGSKTANNPYASGLDCGACGGNHGGGNAAVMATILNDVKIRQELSTRGIHIPVDTVFLAGEHNTTTDEVVWIGSKPDKGNSLFNDFNLDLQAAQLVNNRWRCQTFGLSNTHQANMLTQLRSHDWSQVRPEWGLARNAAFIVAPREITRDINLEARSFLHSYDWRNDPTGKALETILTAPMVVAQWINNQYFFSTVDNIAYGAGSKVTHNVVGKFGVMQGNASDLMHGLPLQSLYRHDNQAYHEPLRLTTIVYAPRERVKKVVDTHHILQKLFYNGWVYLRVIDPENSEIFALTRKGDWSKVDI